jgi:hypothetical protein
MLGQWRWRRDTEYRTCRDEIRTRPLSVGQVANGMAGYILSDPPIKRMQWIWIEGLDQQNLISSNPCPDELILG